MKRAILPGVLVTAISVIVLDQVTKYFTDRLIDPIRPIKLLPVLQLVNVKNKGAAFGMLAGMGNVFFIAISVVAIGFIVYMIVKSQESWFTLSLILGGAIGNLIDRIIYGYVRDFIDVFVSTYHWPAFNVADSALTIGLIILLLGMFTSHKSASPDAN